MVETDLLIRGSWTKTSWEGRCIHCHRKTPHVAKIELEEDTLRFCSDCAESLRGLLESMLEDVPE